MTKETPNPNNGRPLTETLHGQIETFKLFEGLDHRAVEDMARSLEWIDLAKGQVLFRKGDAAEAMYVVQEGLLLASSAEEGCAPAMVGQMGPGALVGEIALLTGGRRNATVTAAEQTRLARLGARDVTAILARHPEMKRAFIDIARHRLRRSQWMKILSEYVGEIDKDKYEFIESRFAWVHVNRGEILFAEGDPADGLYFLVHGFLHVVSQEASGEAKILGAIFRGEIVGETAILSGEKRTATVCAVRDSDLVRLTKTDFEEINKAYPQVSLTIMRILANRLNDRDRTPRRDHAFNIALVPAGPQVPLADFSRRLLERCPVRTRPSCSIAVPWPPSFPQRRTSLRPATTIPVISDSSPGWRIWKPSMISSSTRRTRSPPHGRGAVSAKPIRFSSSPGGATILPRTISKSRSFRKMRT
jgi:NTE family protein/lysophospholipid hydrolase